MSTSLSLVRVVAALPVHVPRLRHALRSTQYAEVSPQAKSVAYLSGQATSLNPQRLGHRLMKAGIRTLSHVEQ